MASSKTLCIFAPQTKERNNIHKQETITLNQQVMSDIEIIKTFKNIKLEGDFVLTNCSTGETVYVNSIAISIIQSAEENETVVLCIDNVDKIDFLKCAADILPCEFVSKKDILFDCMITENGNLVAEFINTMVTQRLDDTISVNPEVIRFGDTLVSVMLQRIHALNIETIRRTMLDYGDCCD